MRSAATSIVACAFSIAFLILAAREYFARGGPMRPRTFASNSTNDPARAERDLLLYQHASSAAPRGATITVLKPNARDADEQMSRVAHGQLPYQRVLPQITLTSDQTAPDFVLTFGGRLDDPRYELIHESPSGSLWKRRP